MKIKVFVVTSIFVALLSSCETEHKDALEETQDKDWTLLNQNDEQVSLSNAKGRPVLLVFWATWCPYCKKLLPGIEQLHKKYAEKGLKIIAVNIREDWKPKIYWKNFGYTFDTVLKGDKVAEQYGVHGTPGLVFIAPSGKVFGVQSFSDPKHPLLEKFAKEGIALMDKEQASK
jgi:cytochrome c biogenesis protein CcmG/thiol:disulfide interchange protein DsbE